MHISKKSYIFAKTILRAMFKIINMAKISLSKNKSN